MSLLEPYINHSVLVITIDGRVLVGELKGTDQAANIILLNCQERVFSSMGTEVVPLGVYVLRGDTICSVGEIDEEKEKEIDITEVKAEPLTAMYL
ncbi:n-alpha-acetyltransferase 38, NatC auxiliary subunit-like protein [Backusella circina FSU 941]|nr:n-alpha-acetyltransferase 38, NatC auxiliary subunit-like protein [Backusella circina FSU 941]